jgi:hypothetical protein
MMHPKYVYIEKFDYSFSVYEGFSYTKCINDSGYPMAMYELDRAVVATHTCKVQEPRVKH